MARPNRKGTKTFTGEVVSQGVILNFAFKNVAKPNLLTEHVARDPHIRNRLNGCHHGAVPRIIGF